MKVWSPCAQQQQARQNLPRGTGASNSLQVCEMSSGDGCQQQDCLLKIKKGHQKGHNILENHLKS